MYFFLFFPFAFLLSFLFIFLLSFLPSLPPFLLSLSFFSFFSLSPPLPPLFFLPSFFTSVSLFHFYLSEYRNIFLNHIIIFWFILPNHFTHLATLNEKTVNRWLHYVMVILGPVLSHVNFRISLSVSTKQLAETLIWIVLNLLIKLGGNNIFTILISPIYEHRIWT